MPEVRALDDSETLTLLHGTISTRRHDVAVPETPMYLDGLLADTPLTGGLEPMLGDQHLRTLPILGFPGLSRPCMLAALNRSEAHTSEPPSLMRISSLVFSLKKKKNRIRTYSKQQKNR